MAKSVVLSMKQIFNACQDQSSTEKKLAKTFWQNAAADEDAWQDIDEVLAHTLHLQKKTTESERIIRLWGRIARLCPEELDEQQEELLANVLRSLGEHSSDESKTVRFRACQLLGQIINNLPEMCSMPEDDIETLQDQLLERLDDKVADARAMAATALKRLTQADEDNLYGHDPVVQALMRALTVEKIKAVRLAIVNSIPLVNDTINEVLSLCRDAFPEVRAGVFTMLQSLSYDCLRLSQRACLLRLGLKDEDAKVQAAAQKLLAAWYAEADSDIVELLRHLDVDNCTAEATLAIEALMSSGQFTVVDFCGKAAKEQATLQDMCSREELLSNEQALLWRIVCKYLEERSTAGGQTAAAAAVGSAAAVVTAAGAVELRDVLEAVLPETPVDMLQLLLRHKQEGPSSRFATCQLVLIAAETMDYTDPTVRAQAELALQELLLIDPRVEDHEDGSSASLYANGGTGVWEQALVQLAVQIYSTPAELAAAMLGKVQEGSAAGHISRVAAEWELGSGTGADMCWLQVLRLLREVLAKLGRAAPAVVRAAGHHLWEDLLLRGGLPHKLVPVRSLAVQCAGWYAYLERSPAVVQTAVYMLTGLLQHDDKRVQQPALQAIARLACTCAGPRAVSRMMEEAALATRATAAGADAAAEDQQAGSDGGGSTGGCSFVQALRMRIKVLLEDRAAAKEDGPDGWMDSLPGLEDDDEVDELSLAHVAAEAAAVLLQHNHLMGKAGLTDNEVVMLLRDMLLVLWYPGNDELPETHDMLGKFFELYMQASASSRVHLAAALPRAGDYMAQSDVLVKQAAALIQHGQWLLQQQQQLPGVAAASSGGWQVELARELLCRLAEAYGMDAQHRTKRKAYNAALLKLLLSLDLSSASAADIAQLRGLLKEAGSRCKEPAARKELQPFQQQLDSAEEALAEEMAQEEVLDLISRIMAGAMDLLPLPEEPEEAGTAGAVAKKGKGKGKAKQLPPAKRKGKAGSAQPQAAKRQSTRAAAQSASQRMAKQQALDSSDSEQETDEDSSDDDSYGRSGVSQRGSAGAGLQELTSGLAQLKVERSK